MDRRALLKSFFVAPALTESPEVARVERCALKPSDVVVIRCATKLTRQTRENIKTHVERIWPNQRVLVLDSDLDLKIIDG